MPYFDQTAQIWQEYFAGSLSLTNRDKALDYIRAAEFGNFHFPPQTPKPTKAKIANSKLEAL